MILETNHTNQIPVKTPHNLDIFSYLCTPTVTKWQPFKELLYISNRRSYSIKLSYKIAGPMHTCLFAKLFEFSCKTLYIPTKGF